MPILGGTRWVADANGDVPLLGERLLQAYDVTCERNAGSNRWRTCRKLHRLTVIER
jgi:putative cell wall-binding protein